MSHEIYNTYRTRMSAMSQKACHRIFPIHASDREDNSIFSSLFKFNFQFFRYRQVPFLSCGARVHRCFFVADLSRRAQPFVLESPTLSDINSSCLSLECTFPRKVLHFATFLLQLIQDITSTASWPIRPSSYNQHIGATALIVWL